MNIKTIATTAAIALAATIGLAACSAPDTTTASGSSSGGGAATAVAAYEPEYAPFGYTDDQWEIILDVAHGLGVADEDTRDIAVEVHREFVHGGGIDTVCALASSMSEEEFQSVLTYSAVESFSDASEAGVAAIAVYALSLNNC